jgi:hypothetical protein
MATTAAWHHLGLEPPADPRDARPVDRLRRVGGVAAPNLFDDHL